METIGDRPGPHAGLRGAAIELIARAAWPPALVLAAHLFLFMVVRLYDRLPGLDRLTHLAGGAAIAYFFSGTLGILQRRRIIGALDGPVRLLLVFTLTATAAMFWEFGEYAVDAWLGTRFQVDLPDTLSDMVFGVAGGLFFLALGRRSGRTLDQSDR